MEGALAARYKAVEGNVTTVAHGSVSEASAESCPGTVLLTNNDNERPCPREHLSYKERAERAEEVQKRSFCRCFWLLLSPQTKVARAGARNYPRRRHVPAPGREIAPALAAGGTGGFTPLRGDTSSAPFGGTCLPAGRSAGLTRHRCVIQHRRPIKGEG